MQIIAGRFRGLKLLSPLGNSSRPTLSHIRQALFNMLAPVLAQSSFLDLYAGAGSIGLESFSQGSTAVVLVESDPAVGLVLKQNQLRLDPGQKHLEVSTREAQAAVKDFLGQKRKFDIIFLDPPYGPETIALWQPAGRLDQLLNPAGWLILQHSRRDAVPEIWAGCCRVKDRVYGDTQLSFFQRPL